MEGTPVTPQRLTTPAAYLLLFAVGGVEGVFGCFQFSYSVGRVPVAAWGFGLLILVTCVLAGAGMGTPRGGLAAAIGWFAVSFVLTLPTPGGSVIINNTGPGKWYLYGGAVCAGVGVAATVRWRPRRAGGPQAGDDDEQGETDERGPG